MTASSGSQISTCNACCLASTQAGPPCTSASKADRSYYHPDKETDPAWIDTWRRAYSDVPDNSIPLLDTTRPGIAPAF